MFKKYLSLLLIGVLLNLALTGVVRAETREEKEARFTEKVKKGIATLGTGEQARIEVRLRDKTKLKGYIKSAGETSFTVVDAKTGAETVVPYTEPRQIKGNNLSTGAKIAIGLAILAGVLALLLFFENYG
ncbi:MAG: hypothetical protein JSS81_26345 [Acidobacteria bacterium]|nr:hypothetical protein [Acidobacteriota bacterium]